MCKQIRRTEKMFGLSVIKPNVDELKMKKKIYRYIFARRNLISGQKLKLEDLVYKRSNLNLLIILINR